MELEKYIWSLDISTTNIGFALWTSKGKLIELKHLELKTDKNVKFEDRIIHKAEIFKKYVLEYKEHILNDLNGEIIDIVIEEPLGGSVNPSTAALLFSFNGIATYILFQLFNLYPVKISVYDGRKLFLDELVTVSHKKNKKTGEIEKIETLSFPPEYRDKKKEYIWKKVANLEKTIEWFYNKNGKFSDINYDLSDSYVTGIAYFKQKGIL